MLPSDSNYATAALNLETRKTRSLQSIIKDLKIRVEKKTRLTKSDLQALLTKLTAQETNAEEAMEILNCCTYARIDENQNALVGKIWQALKTQHDDFQIQHYNCVLKFARDKADIELAEQIFADITKSGVKPDA